MKLPNDLITLIEDADFTIYEDKNYITFGKYSTAGQDFSFDIENSETLSEISHNIYEEYENFDVSYETNLWLDESGHGRNGAPYDMKDVYEDMEECEGFIEELYNIFINYISNVA